MALERLILTLRIQIRPLALQRFCLTTGAENTANGTAALEFNDTGSQNTANGAFALFNNTTGDSNTANGASALNFNTTGNNNTANGVAALSSNTTGGANTALGAGAGNGVTTADTVTCIGANVVGANVSNTTWIASVYGVTTQSGTTAPVIVSDTGQNSKRWETIQRNSARSSVVLPKKERERHCHPTARAPMKRAVLHPEDSPRSLIATQAMNGRIQGP